MSCSRTPPRKTGASRTTQRDDEEEETAVSAEECLKSLKFVDDILDIGHKITENHVEKLKQKLLFLIVNQAKLEGKIETLEKQNERIRQEMQKYQENNNSVKSFASIVAETKAVPNAKLKQIEENKDRSKHTLFITSRNNEDIKEVQKQFTKIVNPTKEKIKIRSLRTTKSAVIVETENEEDAKKILENRKLKLKVNCEKQRKRLPQLILYNVPTNLTNQQLLEAIFEQNFESTMSRGEFEQEFTFKFKTGPREMPTVHHVIEVSAAIRKAILAKQRLYIQFQSIAVKDFLTIPKCRKCHDYGHVMKHCSKEEDTCGQCGENHSRNECQKKEEEGICIPCKLRRKSCKAKNMKDCATYQMLMNRLIQRTDYGQ